MIQTLHDPNIALSRFCTIPNFPQSKFFRIQVLQDPSSAWSKFFRIQILYIPILAWSKSCKIQILHGPNLGQSKSSTIQIFHNPNLVWSKSCPTKLCLIQTLYHPNYLRLNRAGLWFGDSFGFLLFIDYSLLTLLSQYLLWLDMGCQAFEIRDWTEPGRGLEFLFKTDSITKWTPERKISCAIQAPLFYTIGHDYWSKSHNFEELFWT